jgi:hypothetical protein
MKHPTRLSLVTLLSGAALSLAVSASPALARDGQGAGDHDRGRDHTVTMTHQQDGNDHDINDDRGVDLNDDVNDDSGVDTLVVQGADQHHADNDDLADDTD